MTNDFLKSVVKEVGNEYASLVKDGVEAGDVNTFIDTGSYIFNALLSGTIYGGLPSNKITALAGESATGKTYFLMGVVKHFLDADPNAGVIYFESESALTKDLVINRGIDTDYFDSGVKKEENFIRFIKKFNIDLEKKIILYPGRLTDWKGQIEFLNIIEYFKDESVMFYFAGDDKNESYLENFKKKLTIKI